MILVNVLTRIWKWEIDSLRREVCVVAAPVVTLGNEGGVAPRQPGRPAAPALHLEKLRQPLHEDVWESLQLCQALAIKPQR